MIAFTFDNQHKHKYMYLYFATSVCAGTRSHANKHKLCLTTLPRASCLDRNAGPFIQKHCAQKAQFVTQITHLLVHNCLGARDSLCCPNDTYWCQAYSLRAYHSNIFPEHSMITNLYLGSQQKAKVLILKVDAYDLKFWIISVEIMFVLAIL